MFFIKKKKSATATVSAAANAGPADPELALLSTEYEKKGEKPAFPSPSFFPPDTVKNKSRGFFFLYGRAGRPTQCHGEWRRRVGAGYGSGYYREKRRRRRRSPLMHLWWRRSSESSGILDILLTVPMPGIRQRMPYVIIDKHNKIV